jgi:hypothetical protein
LLVPKARLGIEIEADAADIVIPLSGISVRYRSIQVPGLDSLIPVPDWCRHWHICSSIHIVVGEKGYTLHVHTAGCENGYTLHVHTTGGGKEYNLHVHTGGSS